MSLQVKTMAQWMAEDKEVEILFWVGSAGSFDERAKKITRAFVKIMNKAERIKNIFLKTLIIESECLIKL